MKVKSKRRGLVEYLALVAMITLVAALSLGVNVVVNAAMTSENVFDTGMHVVSVMSVITIVLCIISFVVENKEK